MPIRVAIVRLPRLLADLVAGAFLPSDDVRVDLLAEESLVEVGGPGKQPAHDVVIAGVEDPEHAAIGDLLTLRPGLVVVGVRPDGRNTWIYELRPCPRPLGQLGPVVLRRAVLDAVQAHA